ncbi:MAG: cation:proton antiporter, partial [Aggregatilineales bacterium]
MPDFGLLLQYSVSFLLIALAAKQIGKFFSKYGLPYITGYLLAGVLAGPFILEFLPKGATDDLRYVDNISLAVIAFVAGSELYLKDLRDRMRAILLNTAGIVVCGFIIIGLTIFALTYTIPFMADFVFIERLAAALLGATILLALSPASTIAVIQEVRARGTFTQTVLSITVVMDVLIIVLFALVAALADTLLDGRSPDPTFVLLLVIDIVLAVIIGAIVGRFLQFILSLNMNRLLRIAIILGVGGVVFGVSVWIDTQKLGIHLEPLLTTMIAGFYITNFTAYRHDFEDILHEVSPYIYVAFFALTGVALKLDILLASGLIAGILFLARMGGIFIGTFAGGTLAGESKQFRRLAGAGLITQAGIALGLAREVSVEFPTTLGDDFATLLISVVVLNEIFGPILLKTALRRAGESREPGQKDKMDGVRNALILGIEGQAAALARQLQSKGWDVVIADTDETRVAHFEDSPVEVQHIAQIDNLSSAGLLHDGVDALVAMLDDDDANLRAC